MTDREWKALIRMTMTSNNSFIGYYKGVPIELTSNSTLSKVYLFCNHPKVVSPMMFKMDDKLPSLYRKVFKELYNTWHSIEVDNLPF